jgi:large repetitive protein
VLPDGEIVRFTDGTTVLGTATLKDGAARFTTTLESGSHLITAVYAGDSDFAPSISTDAEAPPLTQTVN